MNFVKAQHFRFFSFLKLVNAIKQPEIFFRIFTLDMQMIPDEIFKY